MFQTKINPLFSDSSVGTDVNKSLQPLLIWMRIISIDLSNERKSSVSCCSIVCRWISLIYSNSTWLMTVGVHLSIFSILFASKNPALQEWAKISTWNLLIDIVNMTVHSIGVHSSIHFILNNRWNKLEQSLNVTNKKQLDGHVTFPTTRILEFSAIAVLYVIVSVEN